MHVWMVLNEPGDENSVSKDGRSALYAVLEDLTEVVREKQRLRTKLCHRECVFGSHGRK